MHALRGADRLKRLVCLALFALLAGCNSGPERAEVTGTVTLDGKPVPGAVITFYPEDPQGTTSYGATDYEGKYRLMYTFDKYGALPGKYQVGLEVRQISKKEAENLRAEGQTVPETKIVLPQKYKDPAALSAEVKSGSNTIDFPLTSD